MCINTTHQFSPNLNHCLSSSKINPQGKYRTHRNQKRKKIKDSVPKSGCSIISPWSSSHQLHNSKEREKKCKWYANDKDAKINVFLRKKLHLLLNKNLTLVFGFTKTHYWLTSDLNLFGQEKFLPRLTWLQTPLKSQVSNL